MNQAPMNRQGDTAGGERVLAIAADHPAFTGHFPGRPIVPGVVLIDEAARVLETVFNLDDCRWTLPNAKFLAPAAPGETLMLRWQAPNASGSISFVIERDGCAVASGTLSPQSQITVSA